MVAVLAKVAVILAEMAMMSTAVGANNITVRPTRLSDCLLADLVGGEILHHREKAVELYKIYIHISLTFFLLLIVKLRSGIFQ